MSSYYLERKELKGLLEDGIYKRLQNEKYLVEEVRPKSIVTWNRLDIGFRTLYLDLSNKNAKLADEIYQHDVRAQTLGRMVDPDNSDKFSYEIFRNTFSKTFKDLEENGFDPEKTLIPVSSDGSILNGSHRLSSAIILGVNVWIVRTELPPIVCDYRYFYDRAVPTNIIEMAVDQLFSIGGSFYLAFLWPSGVSKWPETEGLFERVVYTKDVDLTFQGALRLLYFCYQGMNWIGDGRNGFEGLQKKRLECFPRSLSVKIVLFQEPSGLERVRKIKEEVREINGIGFSSVHITDTDQEISDLSCYLLNSNGLHYLNYSHRGYVDFSSEADSIRDFCVENEISSEHLLIDGSFVLQAYGLRKAADIDILIGDCVDKKKFIDVENHDSQLIYHGQAKEDLIYDSRYYFWLNGVKVISLNQMKKFKKARGEVKDKLDLKLMSSLVKENRFQQAYVLLAQKCVYACLRIRWVLVPGGRALLKSTRLYNPLQFIWRKVLIPIWQGCVFWRRN